MPGLFRKAAVERQYRLEGDVVLTPKIHLSIVIAGILTWLLFISIWMVNTTFSRKETVNGWLDPQQGVVHARSQAAGVVERIHVEEGETVKTGQTLLIVNSDKALKNGDHLETALIDEFKKQKALLINQQTTTTTIFTEREQDLKKQLKSALDEQHILDQQKATLTEREHLAKHQLENVLALREKKHVSARQVTTAREKWLEIVSEKQRFHRSQITQENQLSQLEHALQLLPKEKQSALQEIDTQLSQVTQEMTRRQSRRVYRLTASRDGIVSHIPVRKGQMVTLHQDLLTLIPSDSPLIAHLLVPVSAAGFVKAGQSIDLRYDAFPFQKFGIYHGKITHISAYLLLENELASAPIKPNKPVYRVLAHIEQADVQAYGRSFLLKPGMTLSADINLDNRTIVQWLLDPLLSLKGRI